MYQSIGAESDTAIGGQVNENSLNTVPVANQIFSGQIQANASPLSILSHKEFSAHVSLFWTPVVCVRNLAKLRTLRMDLALDQTSSSGSIARHRPILLLHGFHMLKHSSRIVF